MTEVFDRIYLGSGPINLIDASLRASKGERIAIVDSKDQIGGAWVAIPVGEYGELEIGCHIWSYNKAVYQFLGKTLDLKFVAMKPQPYFLNGNKKMIYDHKNLLLTPKNVLREILKGRLKGAVNYALKHPSSRLPIVPKTYQYPGGGAREFQEKLEVLIAKTDIELVLNTQIDHVKFEDDHWTITSAEGKTLKAKNVIMTATSNVKSVQYKDTTVQLEYDFINYTHYHIVVKGAIKKPITYVRVLNNEHVHRVSDITNQLSGNKEGITVLLVGVFDTKISEWGDEAEAGKKIHDYLIEKGFIDESNEMIYQQKNRFPTAYSKEEQRATINGFDPSIELIATTDLIYGFRFRMRKWKEEGLI